MSKQKKCKNCRRLTINSKFCSQSCRNKYDQKNKLNRFDPNKQRKLGKAGGKQTHKLYPNLAKELGKKNIRKSLATCKKEKKGFWNSDVQRENGRKGIETQRRKKIGPFFNKKLHLEVVKKAGKIGGKRVHEIHPNLARDWGRLVHKKYPNQSKENGIKSAGILRGKRNIKFRGVYFDSYGECEIGMNISSQFNIKLKKRNNVHFLVGLKEFDFFIKKCFIEYHPYNPLYDKEDFNLKHYYRNRRLILNKGGYKKYPLIILK